MRALLGPPSGRLLTSNHSLGVRARQRRWRYTLATSCHIDGVGLHSGTAVQVSLHPAFASDGVHFVRTDLDGDPVIPATPSAVISTVLSTTLGTGTASVATVEHLMAALCGAGVRACRVELNAPELPLLDGSASEWLQAIRGAGLQPISGSVDHPALPVRLSTSLHVEEAGSWAIALPADSPRLTVGIDFPHPQHRTWPPVQGPFGILEVPFRLA